MKTPRPSAFTRFAPPLFALSLAALPIARATDGVWTLNNSGVWSLSTNWSGGAVADGIGATADFSQTNINNNRTVTIDGLVASRTVGTLLIGDIDGSHNYSISASDGGTLTFANNGSNALLTQTATSGTNTIFAPVILADHLEVNNASGNSLTISGIISGSKGLVAQNSGVGPLTLSGANTFSGGVTIAQGTVLANNAAALGTGTALLGATSGSADATLAINSFTVASNITVQAGGTGTRAISNNGTSAARLSGNILLNEDLTITADGARTNSNQGALLSSSGTISGTGDLNLNVTGNLSTSNNTNSPQMDNLSLTGPVTTSGAINNIGTGAGRASITGAITGASSVNQNSATSMLSLSGANTYAGETNVNAGILRLASLTALPSANVANVASGATLQISTNSSTAFGGTATVNLAGHGTDYSAGALESTNSANYAGSIVLQDHATIASTLANTTLTLSGGITGSGNTLTTTGAGNHVISGAIATGSGGLIKEGSGTTTLSAANSYAGATQINAGAIALSHADALGGGGDITFDGGSLRHSSSNEVDYGDRISGSAGPVAIDTNSRTVTYSNIDGTNTGGLEKLGAGLLTLSGTNAFTGVISVNAGVLAVSDVSALPATGAGLIFIDSSGALNSEGAYAGVQAWLDSDNISTASTGAIALVAGSSENINFAGYDTLSLGASTNATYTGTLTAANSTYRLGGGGGTLTLSGTDALTGANSLVVGDGNVTLTGANDLAGATTVTSNTLTLAGTAGGLASSAVTVNPGATLAITSSTSGSPVTRASSLTLNRGTLTVAGNSTDHSTDVITNGLTLGAGGNSTITLTQSNAKNVLLTAGELVRETGATALVRGTSLGVNSIASQTANSTNIQLATPNLVGDSGLNTTDGGILVGVVGDTSTVGTGFGATGGLLTYDATNGVRLLSSGEYKTSITDGQTQLDNVQLSSTGGVATTTVNTATTLNSLSLKTSGATSAAISVTGTGTITVNSGVIYSNSVTATADNTIGNAISFNGNEGVILVGGTADLNLTGVLGNTGGKGLTIAGNQEVSIGGTAANTYTGTTTVNGGPVTLSKTNGVTAITGDLVINSGGSVTMNSSNQIADTADVTVNGGTFNYRTETIHDLTVTNSGTANDAGSNGIALDVTGDLTVSNNGTLNTGVATPLNVAGTTTLANGGSIRLDRSQNTTGTYDSVATLGALNITHRATGAYTAITLGHGSGLGQSGGKLVLGGDVTFTGNSTNTNTVLIDAIKGTGRQGVIELTTAAGDRIFNIGNGAAATDLKITAALLDGAGGASGLVKTGLGTLALSGTNTYSGDTTVSAGALTLATDGSLTFYIGANGVNNRVDGSGTATFSGSFNFDTTGANETEGNSWTIVDVGALSESFTGSFLVNGFTETGLNSGVWTKDLYTFTEATGILAYGLAAVPEPSAYALLAGAGLMFFTLIRRKNRASFSA